MLKVDITDDMVKRARDISNPEKQFNQNKIGRRANLTGALGEIVVGDFLKVTRHVYKSFKEMYDYDINYKDIKIEVKTKLVSREPKPFYDCSIFGYNPHQKCDQYWFVNLNKNLTHAFILGYISKDEFKQKAVFYKAGTNRGNLVYKWDNYVVKAYDLNDPIFIRD